MGTVTALTPKQQERQADTLATSLAFQLHRLARRISKGELKDWQLRRIAGALEPELHAMAPAEERETPAESAAPPRSLVEHLVAVGSLLKTARQRRKARRS